MKDVLELQGKFIQATEGLTKTLTKAERDRRDREVLFERTLLLLDGNILSLTDTLKAEIRVLQNYQRDQAPIISSLKEYAKEKKDKIKEAIQPLNVFRKLLGIEQGSKSLADVLVSGIERKLATKAEKKEFAKDYMTFSKAGIAEKNLRGEKNAEQTAFKLFDAIKKKEAELASVNANILKGEQSAFNRPLKKDLELADALKQELAVLTDSGFKKNVNETPTEKFSKSKKEEAVEADMSEADIETTKLQQEQLKILAQIEENTRKGEQSASPLKAASAFGGFSLGSVFGGLKEGLLGGILKLFSPANILKVLGKVFVPAMIVGSLVNGIMDGFKRWKETGDIVDSVIAGLGGILEFLSFGLFDEGSIRKASEVVSDLVNDYIVEPVMGFVKTVKNLFNEYIATPIKNAIENIRNFFVDLAYTITDFLAGIEIPKIGFTIPGTNKEISAGPWHPFSEYKLPPRNNATEVTTKTEAARAAVKAPVAAPANVVSAPTVVTKQTTNNIVQSTTRNQEKSVNNYLQSRQVFL